MTIRTTRTTISFSQPFKLKDLDDIQPAGDYLLDTDEELIEGLSRLAYRRVATLLHLPSTSRPQNRTEVLSVSPLRNSMRCWKAIELSELSER